MSETPNPYFGRRFRVQAAMYAGILCLMVILRPSETWLQALIIAYLILFWPLYFFSVWMSRRGQDNGGDAS